MADTYPGKGGFRVSLKDILSKSAAETLEKVAKVAQSQPKPELNQDKEIEVEVKNDKGNPLPVVLPKSTFGFSEKLSKKIDNLGSVIGQPQKLDQTEVTGRLSELEKHLKNIHSSLIENLKNIESPEDKNQCQCIADSINELAKRIESAMHKASTEDAKRLAEDAIKVSDDANKLQDKIKNLELSVTSAIEAGNQIINSSYSSLQGQKMAAESIFNILKEEGYQNKQALQELHDAIIKGDEKNLQLAMKSIMQDKDNFKKLILTSKHSFKSLEQIKDLNTEQVEYLKNATIQDLFSQKYKKTAAFGKTETGQGLLSMVSSFLGVPGLELVLGPILDVANAIGIKNLATAGAGILGAGKFLGKGALGAGKILGKGALGAGKGALGLGKSVLSGIGKLGKVGGGALGGILSSGITGFGEYQKYKEAEESGASPEELKKIKTKGIAKTAGAGVGGMAGAALGSFLGPIGTVIGGAAGSYVGEKLGSMLGDFIADGGMDNMITSIKEFFINIKNIAVEKFTNALDYVKEMGSNFAEKVRSIFSDIKNYFSMILEDEGILGTIARGLKKIIELSPIGLTIQLFEKITEGFQFLFGQEGIFSKAEKYMAKIMGSDAIKAIVSAYDKIFGTGSDKNKFVGGFGDEPQSSTPEIEDKGLDNTSSNKVKEEWQRDQSFKNNVINLKPNTSAPSASPVMGPTASINIPNTSAGIDDLRLALMVSQLVT